MSYILERNYSVVCFIDGKSYTDLKFKCIMQLVLFHVEILFFPSLPVSWHKSGFDIKWFWYKLVRYKRGWSKWFSFVIVFLCRRDFPCPDFFRFTIFFNYSSVRHVSRRSDKGNLARQSIRNGSNQPRIVKNISCGNQWQGYQCNKRFHFLIFLTKSAIENILGDSRFYTLGWWRILMSRAFDPFNSKAQI